MGAFNNTILRDDTIPITYDDAIGIIPTSAGYSPFNSIDTVMTGTDADIMQKVAASYPACRAIDIDEDLIKA